MAAGTSSPELIASTVGVFLSAENDTGSGTVIGSGALALTLSELIYES